MTNEDKQATRLGLEEMLASILIKLKAPVEDRCTVRSVFRAYLNDSVNFPWSMDRFMFTVGEMVGQHRWYQVLDAQAREQFVTDLRTLANAIHGDRETIIDEVYSECGWIATGDKEEDEKNKDELLVFHGYDEAAIGVAERFAGCPHCKAGFHAHFIVYDRTKTIELIARSCRSTDDGSPITSEEWESAEEDFEFNTADAYHGMCTPAYVTRVEDMPH